MTSERMQRRIEAALDEADAALDARAWDVVLERASFVLTLDPTNGDAVALRAAAERGLGTPPEPITASPTPQALAAPLPHVPTSFAGGRYAVRRFLGEGGKKRVFLAHDARLDRDVAFALIKTDGLDATGRERITREAQAMGRLGAHPHVVTIFEIGDENGAPFVVTELMGGGDVEGLLEKEGGALPLARTLEIAKAVCRGLAFAHQQGIVHRDLKPGNVWLTSDGTAKIGDFGLAVALDRSRLTTHGLMVGTVAYMPPEQALGGEVTPQADLYSLGAMLYELTTGRPPFAGDNPTAIISQHINTPPVAPSWHSEHCPPALEALILNLLAKVPGDRPATAREVLAALEAIDPEAKSASHSDSQANPLDRLARGVFVGRARELERLRAAFDEAFAGRGSVVMLVGEPGVGKTRTVQELSTYARMRGAKVFWGRAHEASGAPAYWPWIQVGRDYAAQVPEEERRRQDQPYAVELQRLFPSLRELFPGLPEPPAENEEGQFRLFDAFSGFVRAVAAETPLLLVLDDLHWADHGTLQLLTHVARELGHARILVAATYRDTDLDRQHPLSRTLAELNRESLFARINLRGLTSDEVGDYIRAMAQVEPSSRLVDRLHEETEGNPFFLAEVVNLMAQEGSFEKTSVSDIAIPEGVKEALGRRLDRLSDDANALLAILAVAGRDFDHALAGELSGHGATATLALVEEALRARVLEESGTGRYRFTHALMQETLLGELSAARRVLLHGQIAEVFERLYGEGRDTLAAVAEHYRESAILNRAHAHSAVRYLRLAAEAAAATFAWDEAARLYQQCLDLVVEAPDSLGYDEAALYGSLGLALSNAGDLPGAKTAFDRAMALYRGRSDGEGFVRVALDALAILGPPPRSEREPIAQAALELAPTPAARAAVIVAFLHQGDYFDVEVGRLAAEARKLAESLHLGALVAELETREGSRAAYEGRWDEAVATFKRAAAMPDMPPGRRAYALLRAAVTSLQAGHVDDALATFGEWEAAAIVAGLPALAAGAHSQSAAVSLSRGDLVRAEAQLLAGEARASTLSATGWARLQAMRGDLDGAIARLARERGVSGSGWRGPMAIGLHAGYLHLRGDADAARRALDDFLQETSARDSEAAITRPAPWISGGVDAIVALADTLTVKRAFETLCRRPSGAVLVSQTLDSLDRLCGALALRLDRLAEAEQYFRAGLELCERERLPVEAGRCLQGLADVAERRGDLEAVRAHLDAAGALFARYGAKLYLDQVLAKKEILKA